MHKLRRTARCGSSESRTALSETGSARPQQSKQAACSPTGTRQEGVQSPRSDASVLLALMPIGTVSHQQLLAAEEPQDGLVASHWPDGIPKQAMYALGFDGSRQMFGHVLDMQNREEEFALVRAHQRHVGSMLLETWLDDALAHDRISDSTSLQIGSMQRQGLQTYGIARNQLKGTGLCDMQVDRLHRSLYVYSVGFGDMLQVCRS